MPPSSGGVRTRPLAGMPGERPGFNPADLSPEESTRCPTPLDRLARRRRRAAAARRAAGPRSPRTGSRCTPGSPSGTPRRVVPYLQALGVTHLYAVADPDGPARQHPRVRRDRPGGLNPEIGTEDDFAAFVADLRAPRHGADARHGAEPHERRRANAGGPTCSSTARRRPYAGYFDIAWDDPPRADLRGRVLLPVLGEPYGQVLEAGRTQARLRRRGVRRPSTGDTAAAGRPADLRPVSRPALDAAKPTPARTPPTRSSCGAS